MLAQCECQVILRGRGSLVLDQHDGPTRFVVARDDDDDFPRIGRWKQKALRVRIVSPQDETVYRAESVAERGSKKGKDN